MSAALVLAACYRDSPPDPLAEARIATACVEITVVDGPVSYSYGITRRLLPVRVPVDTGDAVRPRKGHEIGLVRMPRPVMRDTVLEQVLIANLWREDVVRSVGERWNLDGPPALQPAKGPVSRPCRVTDTLSTAVRRWK